MQTFSVLLNAVLVHHAVIAHVQEGLLPEQLGPPWSNKLLMPSLSKLLKIERSRKPSRNIRRRTESMRRPRIRKLRKLRLLQMRPRLPLVPLRMLLKLQLRKKEAKLVVREERKMVKVPKMVRQPKREPRAVKREKQLQRVAKSLLPKEKQLQRVVSLLKKNEHESTLSNILCSYSSYYLSLSVYNFNQ